MCTQTYNVYHCRCRQKGEFEQCDRLYNLAVNLQCVAVEAKEKKLRSYCSTHLIKEGKTNVVYNILTGKQMELPEGVKRADKGDAEGV